MIGLTNWLRGKRDRTVPAAAAPSPILGFADLFGPIGAATRAAPSDLNLDYAPRAAKEIPAEIATTAPIAPANMADIVAEAIRLVIWDLDETFWSGTLTEGGITWREDHAEIVRTLAARGIVSAICSKNDPARIHPILAEHEMAGFFSVRQHRLECQRPAPGGAGGGRATARTHDIIHRR